MGSPDDKERPVPGSFLQRAAPFLIQVDLEVYLLTLVAQKVSCTSVPLSSFSFRSRVTSMPNKVTHSYLGPLLQAKAGSRSQKAVFNDGELHRNLVYCYNSTSHEYGTNMRSCLSCHQNVTLLEHTLW